MSITDTIYPYLYLNSVECYHYISKITNNFRNIPIPTYRLKDKLIKVDKREYIPYIQKTILSSPKIYYEKLYVPRKISCNRRDILSKMMGKNCFRLYLICRKYNLLMIWYNNSTKEFVIYSNNTNSLARALLHLYIELERFASEIENSFENLI
jgi:hypothetical protein